MTTIDMAKLAFLHNGKLPEWFSSHGKNLKLFASLVREDEREKRAKICEIRKGGIICTEFSIH